MKTPGQKASQAHEKRLEKVIGGSRVAASGAFWSRKGDVRSERFLVEHKFTEKKSFSITNETFRKVEREAIMTGRTPLLGVSLAGTDYVVLLEQDFVELAGLCDTP